MTEVGTQPATERSSFSQPAWRRGGERVVLAAAILAALGMLGGAWSHQQHLRHRWLDIERTPVHSAALSFQLDMNSAEWPEWSLLPGVGEGLAKRIVASRDREGPFRSPEDLSRVQGVGPKTLARIRPFLR